MSSVVRQLEGVTEILHQSTNFSQGNFETNRLIV